jgi:hypothetical protein
MTIWPLYDTGLAADHAVHLGQVVKRPDRLKPDNGQALRTLFNSGRLPSGQTGFQRPRNLIKTMPGAALRAFAVANAGRRISTSCSLKHRIYTIKQPAFIRKWPCF